MVKSMDQRYMMSKKLGPLNFDRDPQPHFLQNGQPQAAGDYSEETAREIDCKVHRIIDEQYARVSRVLNSQQEVFREAAAVLLKKEIITGEELKAIIAKSSARQTIS